MPSAEKEILPLKGKTICVFGATGGIGREITLSLARSGAQLILVAKSKKNLTALAQILDTSFTPLAIPADLANLNQIPAMMAQLRDRRVCLDGLIFATSAFQGCAPVAHTSIKDFAHLLTVNVLAAQQILFHAEDLLAQAAHPRIAFIDCTIGQNKAHWGCYQASKDAARCLAEAYQKEHVGRSVGLFDPGVQATDLWRRAYPGKKVPPKEQLSALGATFLKWFLNLPTKMPA